MHNLIFVNQKRLGTELLVTLAKKIGLNLDQFIEDSRSRIVVEKIEGDFLSGERAAVIGTPSFFLNGEALNSYNGTYISLVNALSVIFRKTEN